MKRLSVISLIIAALTLLYSCDNNGSGALIPRMMEISDFEVVQVIGIDKKGGDIEVTLIADRSGPSGGEGATAAKLSEIVSFSGKTVAEAFRNMGDYTDKRQQMGYVDFLLIGEDAARDGITKYIDFFTRDYESRYSASVFIIRGCSAKDFLHDTASEDRSLDAALGNLDESIDELSNSQLCRIIDLVNSLSVPYNATIVPALKCTELPEAEMIGGKLPKKAFEPAGFAFIKDFKLVAFYDKALAPAYNYLIGKAHGGILAVKDPKGHYVSFMLQPQKLEFSATWDGNTLKSVKYDFQISASVTEQLGIDNLYNEKTMAALSQSINAGIKKDIEKIVNQSQALGQDGFGLGGRVRMKNPVKYDTLDLAMKWGEIFPEVKVEIAVLTHIRRSYDLREPTGLYKYEGNKVN